MTGGGVKERNGVRKELVQNLHGRDVNFSFNFLHLNFYIKFE